MGRGVDFSFPPHLGMMGRGKKGVYERQEEKTKKAEAEGGGRGSVLIVLTCFFPSFISTYQIASIFRAPRPSLILSLYSYTIPAILASYRKQTDVLVVSFSLSFFFLRATLIYTIFFSYFDIA